MRLTGIIAVDDGLTSANYNAADIFFLIGTALAVLGGLAYASGYVGATTADPTAPRPYARFHQWAAALVGFAVAAIAFALFLL